MHNMAINSRNLLTHYDLYTTLNDIVMHTDDRSFNWRQFPYRSFDGLMRSNRAESLLRPMQMTRNCHTLQIPEIYCLCEMERSEMKVVGGEGVRLRARSISY